MKAQKKLNIVLIVLVIILVSIISFVGVYRLDKNQMVNIIPNYKLGTNISGYRKITLELQGNLENSNSETVTLGEEQVDNSVDNETDENEVVANETEENTNNTEDQNNSENYRKSAEVFKSRLKSLKVEDYNITLDESTGKIEITLPENDQTDIILSDLVNVGKFEVTDTNTGEVLLTNKDVRSVNVEVYSQYGYTVPYMNINFNLAGSSKLKDISIEYNENAVVEKNTIANETTNEVSNETANETTEGTTNEISNETTGENANETTDDSVNEVSEGDTSSEETDNTVAKTVDIKVDGTTILSTGFSEIIDNGCLQLTMQAATDEDALKESLYGSYNVAAIIENDPLPEEYEITENIYVQAAIGLNNIYAIIYVLIAVAVILSIFMIIKFKMKGLLMSILSIGYVAVLLLAIRYTNVILSLDGILAVGVAYVVNYCFNYMLLTNIKNKDIRRDEKIEKYKKCMKRYVFVLIPLAILALICCFVNWDTIYSFGMVMFWGILISMLYNLTITNLVIRNK